jgi:hypothetical protein
VALNLVEAKYMAISSACCEAIWLHKLIGKLTNHMLEPTFVHYNNQSCIELSENPVFRDHSNQIDIRCHFPRDKVQKGVAVLDCVPTDLQAAKFLRNPSKGSLTYSERSSG